MDWPHRIGISLGLILACIGMTPCAETVDPILTEDAFAVQDAISSSDTASATALLRAIPSTEREDLLPILLESLRSENPSLVEAALDGFEDGPAWFILENLDRTRSLLTHDDSRIRWLAARFTGKLKDDLAIDDLILLLDDEKKIAEAAHTALVTIFDTDAGTTPQLWLTYYDAWLEVEKKNIPFLAQQLEASNDPDEQAQLIMQLLQFNTHRHTVGNILADYQFSQSPSVAKLATTGMNNIGGVAKMQGSTGPDINDLITAGAFSEDADTTAASSPAAPATSTADESSETASGPSASQIITVVVLILLAGAGAFSIRKITRERNQRKGPPPSNGSGGDDEPGGKSRFTFSS